MEDKFYNLARVKGKNPDGIGCTGVACDSEAIKHWTVHGNFWDKCFEIFCKDYDDVVEIPSRDKIREAIFECKLAILDLYLQISVRRLDVYFKTSRDELMYLENEILELEKEFKEACSERRIQEFYNITSKVHQLRVKIEESQVFSNVNKYLSRIRINKMKHADYEDVIKNIEQNVIIEMDSVRDLKQQVKHFIVGKEIKDEIFNMKLTQYETNKDMHRPLSENTSTSPSKNDITPVKKCKFYDILSHLYINL